MQSDEHWLDLCSRPSPNGTTRIKLAKKLLEHWKSIDQSIPRLSPSAEKWLRKEREVKRFYSLEDAPEFHIEKVSYRSKEIIKILTLLSNSQFKSKKEEVFLWAILRKYMGCSAGAGDIDFYWHYSKLLKLNKIYPPKELIFDDDKNWLSVRPIIADFSRYLII